MLQDYSYGSPKRKIKKDYQVKQFVNPYFGPKKKTFNAQLYIRIILAIFFVYLIIYSDLLKIKTIEISGTDIINPEEIRAIIQNNLKQYNFLILPQNNLLLIDKNRLITAIGSQFSLNQLTIKRNWQKLSVQVEEKVSSLIITNNKNFYLCDNGGVIIKAIASEEINKYKTVYPVLIITQDSIKIGDIVSNGKIINYLIDLDKNLKDNKFSISGYRSGGVDEITFLSTENWQAYFDVNSDVNVSIANLITVLKQKIPDRSKLSYIDLRLGDKVPICLKGEQCQIK